MPIGFVSNSVARYWSYLYSNQLIMINKYEEKWIQLIQKSIMIKFKNKPDKNFIKKTPCRLFIANP